VAILRDLSELLFSSQKDHSPSVKARLNLIDALHAKVMVHYSAKQDASQGEADFDEHLKNLQVNLEESSGRWKAAAPQDDSERYSYHMEVAERAIKPFRVQFPGKGATVWETVELMADLECHPTLAQLSVLLYSLWVYWDGFQEDMEGPKNDFEAALDLNLAKLSYHVGVETSSIRHWGRRELTRTKKSAKAKKEKNDKRKAFIIAIYEHGEPIKPRTKFNKACDMLQSQFNDSRGKDEAPWGTIPENLEEMPTPCLSSIGRWLKEEGIFSRDFKQEGRYWIKHT
jgi:hypothetical protein